MQHGTTGANQCKYAKKSCPYQQERGIVSGTGAGTFRMTASPEELSWKYCVETLPKVSRTFALNIRVLTGELHRCVLLGYLICRIVDTVEDSFSLAPHLKGRFLRRFPGIVESAEWEELLREWIRELKDARLDGNPADVELLEQSRRVISCFKRLPPGYQRLGERMVSTMAPGMAEYSERSRGGPFLLHDLDDLKRYCYCVAGVVGEFLLDGFLLAYAFSDRKAQILREHCTAFGLGLQMTNIAKDMPRDRRRGQIFLPESFLREAGLSKEQFLAGREPHRAMDAYRRLLEEAHAHLVRGCSFTLAIHRRYVRLRLFCIWPLWMAFETLKTLGSQPDLLQCGREAAISRRQVKRILLATTSMIGSNGLIERSFLRNYGDDGSTGPTPPGRS